MAKQLHDMVDENYFQPPPGFEEEGSFLKNVIEPIFKVLQKVSAKSSGKIHIKLLDVLCLQVIILHSPWRKHKKVEGVQQATQLGEIMTTWMNYFGNFSTKLLQT